MIRCDQFVGANFRVFPSLDEAAIADVIPCNASVVLTGGTIRGDGEVWLEAEWNGQRGWVAQVMLSQPQQATIQTQPVTVPAPQPAPPVPLPEKARAKAIEVGL